MSGVAARIRRKHRTAGNASRSLAQAEWRRARRHALLHAGPGGSSIPNQERPGPPPEESVSVRRMEKGWTTFLQNHPQSPRQSSERFSGGHFALLYRRPLRAPRDLSTETLHHDSDDDGRQTQKRV